MPSTKRSTDYRVRTIFSADDRLTKSLRTIVGRGVRTIRGLASASKTAAIGIAGIGAAGAGAAYGVYRLTRSYSESVDALDEQAQAIGMSAQALREWQGVAERNGMSADQIVTAFGKMNKSVSEARDGTGALATTLKNHLPGVYKQIKAAQSNEEAQSILFRAIRSVKDEMDRGKLAQDAFGRSGSKLLPIILQGDEAIDGMRANVRRLRGELSDASVKEASDFEDAILDVGDSLKGLRDAIGSELVKSAMPAVKELTEWLTDKRGEVAKEIASSIKEIASELAKVDWRGLAGDMLDAAKGIASTLTTVIDAAKLLGGDFSVLGQGSRKAGSQGQRPARLQDGRIIAPLSEAPRSAADLGTTTYGGQGAPLPIMQMSGGVSGLVRVVVEATKGTSAEVVATQGRGIKLKAEEHSTGSSKVAR